MAGRRLYTVAGVLFIFLTVYEFLQGPLGVLLRNLYYLSLMLENLGQHLLPFLQALLCPAAYVLLAVVAFRGRRGKSAPLLWELAGGLMAVYLLWMAYPLVAASAEDPFYWTYVATAIRSGLLAVLWVLFILSGRLVSVLQRRRTFILYGFAAVYAVCAVAWACILIPYAGLKASLVPLLTDNLQSAAICFALWSLGKAASSSSLEADNGGEDRG